MILRSFIVASKAAAPKTTSTMRAAIQSWFFQVAFLLILHFISVFKAIKSISLEAIWIVKQFVLSLMSKRDVEMEREWDRRNKGRTIASVKCLMACNPTMKVMKCAYKKLKISLNGKNDGIVVLQHQNLHCMSLFYRFSGTLGIYTDMKSEFSFFFPPPVIDAIHTINILPQFVQRFTRGVQKYPKLIQSHWLWCAWEFEQVSSSED